MTLLHRQQISLDAYFKLLKGKGVADDDIARRQQLLEKLLPLLAKRPVKGEYYRGAVDEALLAIEKVDWPFFLTVARDFFHFWVNDFKAIAALHERGVFEPASHLPLTPEGTLKDLWARLDTEKFSVSEKWPINTYKAALRDEGIENEVIDIRIRLAQLLLIQLRKVEGHDSRAYRLAAESMLPVFAKKETSELFISAVREFFHFWLGDPNAAERISSAQAGDQGSLW